MQNRICDAMEKNLPVYGMALFQVKETPKHSWQEEFQNQRTLAIG